MGKAKPTAKGRTRSLYGEKPFASKLKGGITFGVLAATILAAEAVASGKAGDSALAKAIAAQNMSHKEGRRAFDLADQVFRHWARLGWIWERIQGHPGGRERVLLALRLFLKASSSEVAALLRGRDGVEPLYPVEANTLDKVHDAALNELRFPAHVRLECPEPFIGPLRRALDDTYPAELERMLEPPSVWLRVNALKTNRAEALEGLARINIVAEPGTLSPLAIKVSRDAEISATQMFRDGAIEIQDEGSQLVAALVGAQPGLQILDLCAGAGGKTLMLAGQMANTGHLVAADTHPGRLARAKQRLKRAGVVNAECVAVGSKWVKSKRGRFDRVLVDAPCSGTGAWARNPDQRWTLDRDALTRLAAEQDGLLDQASRLVKPGGRVIYATCSFLLEENEDRIRAFLARTPTFELIPAKTVWDELGFPAWPCASDEFFRVTPARHGTDGFFAAVLTRNPLATSPE